MPESALLYNKRQAYHPGTWRHIQICVGSQPDGIPGPMTTDAVRAWQQNNGKVADGRVGPMTLAAIGARRDWPADDPFAITNRIAADSSHCYGIDISDYQDLPDWRKVRNAGVRFAIIKLSQGTDFRAKHAIANWWAALEQGIAVSGYHYANMICDRSKKDPLQEAENFLAVLQELSFSNTLPNVIDLETKQIQAYAQDMGTERTCNWIQRWVQTVAKSTGTIPMLYLSHRGTKILAGHCGPLLPLPTWWADHHEETWGQPPLREPVDSWPDWTFRQFTGKGRVPGINGDVDLDYYNGQNPTESLRALPPAGH